MKRIVFLFVLLSLSYSSFAQKSKWNKDPQETEEKQGAFMNLFQQPVEYDAMFDYQLLPKSGAEGLTALLRAPYAPWSDKSKRRNRRVWWRIALRATKLVFLDYAAADYYTTLQREIFGTGAYARLLGRDSIKYKVTPFSIFSRPEVRYALPIDTSRINTIDENIALAMAGFESTGNTMTEVLRQKFITGGKMSHELSLLYLTNKLDQVRQVFGASGDFSNLSRNNIEQYVYSLNQRYLDSSTVALGLGAVDSFKFKMGALKAKSLISIFLDPTVYLAAFNVYGFLVDAKKFQSMPSLRLGKWGYIPTFHLGLTPYGDEIYWHNYLIDPAHHIWHLKLRFGNNAYTGTSWSVALNCSNFRIPKVGNFQVQAEVWQQPKFYLGGESLQELAGGVGGMFSASYRSVPLFKLVPIQIYGQLGYKSSGYTPGENLNNAFIARVGISYPDFFRKDKAMKESEISNQKKKKK